jgi:hypothetical protein
MADAATKLPAKTDVRAAARSSTFGKERTAFPAAPAQDASRVPASLDQVRRIIGDIDDATAVTILALHPTPADLEQAALWAAGNGDVLAKQGHSLTGIAAAIFDLLTADEDEP